MARNKEFDEQDVLEKAMEVFWEQGYEKTSVQDLVNHMGIHRRSIYDTFGDKHSLFIQALDHYEKIINKKIQSQLTEEMSIKACMRQIFEAVTNVDSTYPKGCLIVNSAAELSLIDDVISEKVKEIFAGEERQISSLLSQAQERGEISSSSDISALSSYIHNSLIGIRVLTKTTDNKEKLDPIIELTLSVLK